MPTTPFASTDNFSAINETGVTSRGRVNPHGLATVAHFEYGTTDAYGTIFPITLTDAAGVTSEDVAAVRSGLAPGTRYHWRIVAVNSARVDGVRYDTLRDPLYRGGTVAFAARLSGNRVRATNAETLMAGAPGALRLVARTGHTIYTVEVHECAKSAEGAPSFSPGLRAARYPGTWIENAI